MGTLYLHSVCGISQLFIVSLIFFTPLCDGGKILVYPFDGSHWINMKLLIEQLHSRGHSITVIRDSTSMSIEEKSPFYTSITIQSQKGLEHVIHAYLQNHVKVQREGASAFNLLKIHKDFMFLIHDAHALCCDFLSQILENANMLQDLINAKYDLVLTDPAIGGGLVLAKYLNLPTVLNARWITAGEGHFVIAPSPLSYVPAPGSGLTDRMNFIQRLKNIFFHGLIEIQQRVFVGPQYDAICAKYIQGGCDTMSLLQEADIWLFRSDFVFDFPRPTMPNVVYIGGFQCKPAQPLPAELEDFVQSAGTHGVIVMTLGAWVKALPNDIADDIASVFAKMPQKVIWRHMGKRPSTLGNNTLLVKWMPQKDLLGHPQTKMFVAHGGTNGVQEAIYHGVPILGLPLFFDQYDNLLRLQERGAGKILQLGEFSRQTFEQSLKEVLNQESYRENMRRLSSLHRDQPIPPMEHAIFWIEYVIRHKGAAHLRTQAHKMAWYSYYCLDVLLLLLTAAAALVLSMFAIIRFLCCRARRKTKTKQH